MTTDKVSPRLKRTGPAHEGRLFEFLCAGSTWFGLVVLLMLMATVGWQAAGWLDWQFLSSFDSSFPEKAGVLPAIWGTFWLILLTATISIPIGVGAAIYLEEYARDSWLTRLIQVNLSNLAGVPSIVYGVLGLTVFVRMFDLFGKGRTFEISGVAFLGMDIPLPLQRCLLSGALTLSLLILPVIIVASQEALRAVPQSLRHASLALGATRWQTIRHQILPAATPGIVTGIILAISRAVGETAPLLMIGALGFTMRIPAGIERPQQIVTEPGRLLDVPFSGFTTLTIQIYNWAEEAREEYWHLAAAGIVVLLAVLLALNGLAIIIRHRHQKTLPW